MRTRKWNAFIRDKIKQLNEKYDEKADSIPVLPDQIKVEEIKEFVKAWINYQLEFTKIV